MKVRYYAILSALLLALSVVFVGTPASSASVLDTANSRIVNFTPYTITGGYAHSHLFHVSMVNVNVRRRTAFGEPGLYEPRNLHVRPNWCMKYHFHVYGQRSGRTTTICAGSRVAVWGVYFGTGWRGADYDVVVTAYYPR